MEFDYGPVDIFVVRNDGPTPGAGVLEELARLSDNEVVRLLDLVIVAKQDDGDVSILELADLGDTIEVTAIELEASGLVGEEDIEGFTPLLEPGESITIAAIEQLWAKSLASRLASSGGVVVQRESIPAPVVNAVLASGEGD